MSIECDTTSVLLTVPPFPCQREVSTEGILDQYPLYDVDNTAQCFDYGNQHEMTIGVCVLVPCISNLLITNFLIWLFRTLD